MISNFSGEFDFLSNFHPARVAFGGIVFPTVEHAFQAAKSNNREDWIAIAALRTAGQARKSREVDEITLYIRAEGNAKPAQS